MCFLANSAISAEHSCASHDMTCAVNVGGRDKASGGRRAVSTEHGQRYVKQSNGEHAASVASSSACRLRAEVKRGTATDNTPGWQQHLKPAEDLCLTVQTGIVTTARFTCGSNDERPSWPESRRLLF